MRYNLAQMWRRQSNPRRREVTLRKIVVPSTFASDLYADCYKPVIEAWTAAVDPITQAYEQALSELTQDSPEQVGASLSAVEASVAGLVTTLRLRLEAWAARVERFQRGKWRSAVLSATNVDIGTLIGPADVRTTLGAAIEANVGLVKSVSDEARQRISNEVFEGLRARKPAREVAAGIREKVAMSRRRALNIASDQNTKLGEALNEERRREAGMSTWTWVSSHALHYRIVHHERDGKRYDDNATEGKHKPPSDRPGQLIHCKCTSRAVLTLTGEF